MCLTSVGRQFLSRDISLYYHLEGRKRSKTCSNFWGKIEPLKTPASLNPLVHDAREKTRFNFEMHFWSKNGNAKVCNDFSLAKQTSFPGQEEQDQSQFSEGPKIRILLDKFFWPLLPPSIAICAKALAPNLKLKRKNL